MTDKKFTAEFRFTVEIEDMTWGAFTDCTLPTLDMESEIVKEGGLNTFVHQLPGMLKPSKITVKNGIGYLDSMNQWMNDVMKGKFSRKKITVNMMNEKGEAYLIVTMQDAFPTKWNGPQLKTDSNLVAIHSLEFSGGEVTLEFKK